MACKPILNFLPTHQLNQTQIKNTNKQMLNQCQYQKKSETEVDSSPSKISMYSPYSRKSQIIITQSIEYSTIRPFFNWNKLTFLCGMGMQKLGIIDVYAVNAVLGGINGFIGNQQPDIHTFKNYLKRSLLKIMLFKLKKIYQGLILMSYLLQKICSLEICQERFSQLTASMMDCAISWLFQFQVLLYNSYTLHIPHFILLLYITFIILIYNFNDYFFQSYFFIIDLLGFLEHCILLFYVSSSIRSAYFFVICYFLNRPIYQLPTYQSNKKKDSAYIVYKTFSLYFLSIIYVLASKLILLFCRLDPLKIQFHHFLASESKIDEISRKNIKNSLLQFIKRFLL